MKWRTPEVLLRCQYSLCMSVSQATLISKYTVTRRRAIKEILENLPHDALERDFFESDLQLLRAFHDGSFNCWGVPPRAEPSFLKTEIGDLVLMIPHIGLRQGGIHQLGVIQAKCPDRCYEASRILWPNTPNARLFPFIFFFHAEIGYRNRIDFLQDVGMKKTWNPHGWYRRIDPKRFSRWGGADGYLSFLRNEAGFHRLE